MGFPGRIANLGVTLVDFGAGATPPMTFGPTGVTTWIQGSLQRHDPENLNLLADRKSLANPKVNSIYSLYQSFLVSIKSS